MNRGIKNIVNSDSWKEVEQYFYNEMIYKQVDIKTKGKSNEEIVRELVAREMAVEMVKKAINKLKMIANNILEDRESYR